MQNKSRYLAATAIAIAIAVVAVIAVASSGNGSSKTTASASIVPTSAHSTYGHPPKGLKIAYPPGVTTVTASLTHPDEYAIQGYDVRVVLPTGSALMQVEGPAVPIWVEQERQAGKLALTTSVPCVFTVTVRDVKGSIPLNASDWATVQATDQATTIRATPTGPNITVTTGETRTWKIKTKLPDGDGIIRWSPGGKHPIAAWSWQLEYD